MNKYQQYTVEDFVQDPNFRNWILAQTPENQQFWDAYCAENPQQQEDIDTAKSMVMAGQLWEMPTDKSAVQANIAKIMAITEGESPAVLRPIFRRTWWALAASLALLVSIGFWWFSQSKNANNTEGGQNAPKLAAETTDKLQKITLPDGSVVTLEKNSRLDMAQDFNGTTRTVHLTGEAFFDVVKNPSKPFIVHAGNLVTKVLGTSFRIKALTQAGDVTVNVVTGRVSVFANKKNPKNDPETDGLILTPNQKVVFAKAEESLKRTLIEAPAVIIPQEDLKQMVFEEAPVSVILKAIEKAYGVEVVFDEEQLKNCALTTTLKNETLFDKLTIICKSIGATYKVVDAQVIIDGEACL
jgi:transmembrane sensor